MGEFIDNVVIVTGAGGGLGLAHALEFARSTTATTASARFDEGYESLDQFSGHVFLNEVPGVVDLSVGLTLGTGHAIDPNLLTALGHRI